MDISTRKITSKKVRGNNVDFSAIEIKSKKVRGNNVDFLTIEITSVKVRGNNLGLLTIKITLKKVRGNDVKFLISEITPVKYVEKAWKFFEIWSLTYYRNIDDESAWIRSGVPVGSLFLGKHESLLIGSNSSSLFLLISNCPVSSVKLCGIETFCLFTHFVPIFMIWGTDIF